MTKRFVEALNIADRVSPEASDWSQKEYDLIRESMARQSTGELKVLLSSADVWVEECQKNAYKHFFDNSELNRRGAVWAVNEADSGSVRRIGRLMGFSRTKLPEIATYPGLGEHTEEVLRNEGFASSEIGNLMADKVILG